MLIGVASHVCVIDLCERKYLETKIIQRKQGRKRLTISGITFTREENGYELVVSARYDSILLPEVLALESLAELPVSRRNIPCRRVPAVASSNPEGQRLPYQHGVTLPFLTPIPSHRRPLCLIAFHLNAVDVPGSPNIGYEYLVEVRVPGDCESDPSLLRARNPVT